ncbi:uncharacterized protein LOC109789643 [Cajanus cajan]|uniref:uncharacterized protein LOC109789643 n=1 Tax=Cajanus cajan TaxID=3821 RepID=UPI00098D792D|nr:uncharacterized protein LOC109789643 [Cajanus cajan]
MGKLAIFLWNWSIKLIGLLKMLNFDPLSTGEKRKLELHALDELRLQAFESSKIYKEKVKSYHDRKILKREFGAGQSVLLFNSRLKLFLGKLRPKWSGPFRVKEVKPYGAIEIEDPEAQRSWVVNGQRLKPYLGGEVERLCCILSFRDP